MGPKGCGCVNGGSRRKILIILTLLVVLVAFNTLFVLEDSTWRSSFNQTQSPVLEIPLSLELPEDTKRTFFFVETSSKTILTAREACAIESVARLHPKDSVQVLHMAPEFNHSHRFIQIFNYLYPNVLIKNAQLEDLMKGSPMEPWIKTRPWMKSPYNVSHLSDIMRSLLMWKHGGVYLDMDIVALKPFNDLRNTIGLQSKDYLAAGVLIFDKGHPLINDSIRELANNYRPRSWGFHGPDLYTRTIKRLCNVTKLKELSDKKCLGITVMPPSAFYPIFYPFWKKYFSKNDAGETIIQWMNSYTIHVWNKLAEKEPVFLGSGQPYDLAAKYFCPEVHQYMRRYKQM